MQWAVSNSAEQRGWRGRPQEVARGWKPPCTGEYRIYISSGSDVRSQELPLTGFQGLAFLGLCSSFLCFFWTPVSLRLLPRPIPQEQAWQGVFRSDCLGSPEGMVVDRN